MTLDCTLAMCPTHLAGLALPLNYLCKVNKCYCDVTNSACLRYVFREISTQAHCWWIAQYHFVYWWNTAAQLPRFLRPDLFCRMVPIFQSQWFLHRWQWKSLFWNYCCKILLIYSAGCILSNLDFYVSIDGAGWRQADSHVGERYSGRFWLVHMHSR